MSEKLGCKYAVLPDRKTVDLNYDPHYTSKGGINLINQREIFAFILFSTKYNWLKNFPIE